MVKLGFKRDKSKPHKPMRRKGKKRKYRNITSPQSLADAAFSKYIRRAAADANGYVRCVTCNMTMRWQDAQAGHYFRRELFAVRYDERNVHPQCEHCNYYLQGNMGSYAMWMLHKYGYEELTVLGELAHQSKRMLADEYDAIKIKYRAKLKQLESEK